jgi:hypothetical protein
VNAACASAIGEKRAGSDFMPSHTCIIIDDDIDMRAVLARVARMAALEAESYDSAESFLRRRLGIDASFWTSTRRDDGIELLAFLERNAASCVPLSGARCGDASGSKEIRRGSDEV